MSDLNEKHQEAPTDEYGALIAYIKAQKSAGAEEEGDDGTHIVKKRNLLMPWKVKEIRVDKNGEEEEIAAKVPQSWWVGISVEREMLGCEGVEDQVGARRESACRMGARAKPNIPLQHDILVCFEIDWAIHKIEKMGQCLVTSQSSARTLLQSCSNRDKGMVLPPVCLEESLFCIDLIIFHFNSNTLLISIAPLSLPTPASSPSLQARDWRSPGSLWRWCHQASRHVRIQRAWISNWELIPQVLHLLQGSYSLRWVDGILIQ